MTCRCSPALVQLRRELDTHWPGRDRASDGCCGNADHATRRSDHNGDAAGYAHALDVDEDLRPGLQDGGLTFLVWVLLDDPRTKYVIYEGRIYYPGQAPRAYTGPNAHDHHLHLSIKSTATHNKSPWLEEATMPTADEIADAVIRKLDEGVPRGQTAFRPSVYATAGTVAALPTRIAELAKKIDSVRDEIRRGAGPGGGVTNPELAAALRAAANELDS